jgi:endonuclease-3
MLERAVPKNRGAEFLDLIEDLTNDTCVESNPDCHRCELRKICAFALNRKTEARSAGKASATKAAKEPAKSARSKPAEKAPARAIKKKPPTRPAKEQPRSGGTRGGKRRGAK